MPMEPHPNGYPIKVVRDNTAEILMPETGERGELFYGQRPKGTSRKSWLSRKLGEEALEYVMDGTQDELVQVLQVVKALAGEHGMTFEELLERAEKDPRGGFMKCVIMYGLHPKYDL